MEKTKNPRAAAETAEATKATLAGLIEIEQEKVDSIAKDIYAKFAWIPDAIEVCMPKMQQFTTADGRSVDLLRRYLVKQYTDGHIQNGADAARALMEVGALIVALQGIAVCSSQMKMLAKIEGVFVRDRFDQMDRLASSTMKFVKTVNEIQVESAVSRKARLESGVGGGGGIEAILDQAAEAGEELLEQSTCMILLEPPRKSGTDQAGGLFDPANGGVSATDMDDLRQ